MLSVWMQNVPIKTLQTSRQKHKKKKIEGKKTVDRTLQRGRKRDSSSSDEDK